jgi:hypothetical protein
MSKDDKPKLIIRTIPQPSEQDTERFRDLLRARGRTRPEAELEPIAMKIAQNAEIMERFRAAFGSNDQKLVGQLTRDVIAFAQGLDPTIDHSEGVKVVTALMKVLGYFEPIPDKNG